MNIKSESEFIAVQFLRTTAEDSRAQANPCPWHKSSLLQVVENPGTSSSFRSLRQDETEYQPTSQRKKKEEKETNPSGTLAEASSTGKQGPERKETVWQASTRTRSEPEKKRRKEQKRKKPGGKQEDDSEASRTRKSKK